MSHILGTNQLIHLLATFIDVKNHRTDIKKGDKSLSNKVLLKLIYYKYIYRQQLTKQPQLF